MLELGQKAPDFSLKSHLGTEIKLSDYLGKKNVVLVFYPLDFSPMCSSQILEYSSRKANIESLGAEIIGVNRDSIYTHKAWAREFGIDIPLMSDMKGEVAKKYGVYIEEEGVNNRAVFIIDEEGIVRFEYVEGAPSEYTLHADRIISELKKL